MKVGTKFENLNVQPFKDWFKENECETLQDLQKIICYDAHWNKMICQCNMPLDFFVELKRQVSEIVDERIRVHLSKINKNTDKRIRRCPRFKSKPPWLSSSSDNSWDLEDDSSSDNLHEMPTSNPSQHSQIRRQHDERLEKAVFNQDDYPQNFLVRILRHQGAGFLGFVAAFPWTVIINPSDDKRSIIQQIQAAAGFPNAQIVGRWIIFQIHELSEELESHGGLLLNLGHLLMRLSVFLLILDRWTLMRSSTISETWRFNSTKKSKGMLHWQIILFQWAS